MKGNDDINLLSISSKHTNAPVSNQLGVTWESLLTTLYWEFLWFMSTKNFIIEFLWGKKMVWFYRMLCRNNGRLYEHEYNLKCLALKETSYSLKKNSLYTLLQALLSHSQRHPRQYLPSGHYIMVHTVVSTFPKGAPLKLVSHFCDAGLFQSFRSLLFGLVEPDVTLSQSRGRLQSSITCLRVGISTVSSLEGCFWIESCKLFPDSNALCLRLVPQSLLTYYGARKSNYCITLLGCQCYK